MLYKRKVGSLHYSKSRGKLSGGADYIVPVGILAILGVVAYELFGSGSGSPGTGLSTAPATGGNNAGTQQANAASTAKTLADQSAAGQNQTLPDVTLQGIASQVFSLGNTQDPDLYTISSLLSSVQNLTDLTKVIQYFGTKAAPQAVSDWTMCGALGLDCTQLDLPSFVRLIFGSTSDNPDAAGILANINSFYTEQGIKYQF